ncbi:MAG: hypothetical protein FJ264_01870 [Planctomycetes bacterium]|nr:hypothetical protein [Planctomycetota bacterium]
MIVSPLNPMLKHGVKTWAIFQKAKVLRKIYYAQEYSEEASFKAISVIIVEGSMAEIYNLTIGSIPNFL